VLIFKLRILLSAAHFALCLTTTTTPFTLFLPPCIIFYLFTMSSSSASFLARSSNGDLTSHSHSEGKLVSPGPTSDSVLSCQLTPDIYLASQHAILTPRYLTNDIDHSGCVDGQTSKSCIQFGLSHRRAGELVTPGTVSALRDVSAMTQEAIPSYQSKPKVIEGLGLGLPSNHPLRTPRAVTVHTLPVAYGAGDASPPCHLSYLEFKPSSSYRVSSRKQYLRPTVITNSPSPIDALPSPMFGKSRIPSAYRRTSPSQYFQQQAVVEGLPSTETFPSPLFNPARTPSPVSAAFNPASIPIILPRRATQCEWPSPLAPQPILHPQSLSISCNTLLTSNRRTFPKMKPANLGLGLLNILPSSSPSMFYLNDITMRPKTRRQSTRSSSLSSKPTTRNAMMAGCSPITDDRRSLIENINLTASLRDESPLGTQSVSPALPSLRSSSSPLLGAALQKVVEDAGSFHKGGAVIGEVPIAMLAS
jgi:hypothetical protein